MSEQDLLREAIKSVDLMEFPTYYQQQPMYQPSQQTMIQPQPLIQPVQQTSGGSIQDKQIALAVLKEFKEIKTLLYPLKDVCEMMAKKQQSCSVQFQAQEIKVPFVLYYFYHQNQIEGVRHISIYNYGKMAETVDTDTSEIEKMFNEMFAYRYTDEDKDYVSVISKPIPPCPCVPGYFLRGKKNYNNRDRDNRNDGRGQWGHHGGHNRDNHGYHGSRYQDNRGYRDNRHNYDNRYDRNHHRQRYNPY
ncbi:hypothetical protein ACF0H5_017904 [Mactra antiquata]